MPSEPSRTSSPPRTGEDPHALPPPARPAHARSWLQQPFMSPVNPAEQFKFGPGPRANALQPAAGPSGRGDNSTSLAAPGGTTAPPQLGESRLGARELLLRSPSQTRLPPLDELDEGDENAHSDTIVLVEPPSMRTETSSHTVGRITRSIAPFRRPDAKELVGLPSKSSPVAKSSVFGPVAPPNSDRSSSTTILSASGGANTSSTGSRSQAAPLMAEASISRTRTRYPHDTPSSMITSSQTADTESSTPHPDPSLRPGDKRLRADDPASNVPTSHGNLGLSSSSATTKKRSVATGHTLGDANKTHDSGSEAHELKRRKTADAKSAVHVIMDLDADLRKKDAELAKLRDRISQRDTELEQLSQSKHKLKGELSARVRTAVESAAVAQRELSIAKTSMEQSLKDLKDSLGPLSEAAELQRQLGEVKEVVKKYCLDDNNELCLERVEETKLAVLKNFQAELAKRDDVIKILRAELDNKAGSLAETRAHAEQLETAYADAQSRIGTLQNENLAQLEKMRANELRHRDELDKVLVHASEREVAMRAAGEAMEAKLAKSIGEGLEREEKLRDEWIRAKEEAALHEAELQGKASRIAALEAKEAEDSRTIEHVKAELRVAREELTSAIERSTARLKQAHDDFERERVEHVSRVAEAASACANELAEAQAALIKANAAHQEASARREAELAAAKAANATLLARVEQTEESLAGARRANEDLERAQDELQGVLEDAEYLHNVNTDSHAKELGLLHDRIGNLQHEKESLVAAKQAAEALRALTESHDGLQADKQAAIDQITRLQRDVAELREDKCRTIQTMETVLREAELRHERTLAAREKELSELAAQEKQQAAAAALQQGKELVQAELNAKGNELKRANNKVEELNKKLNRALSELAEAKARPILDPNIAASSPAGESTSQIRPTAPAGQDAAPAGGSSSSPLTALPSSSHAPTGGTTSPPKKSKKKSKHTSSPTTHVIPADAGPAKSKHRTSATHVGPKRSTKVVQPAVVSTVAPARRARVSLSSDNTDEDSASEVQGDAHRRRFASVVPMEEDSEGDGHRTTDEGELEGAGTGAPVLSVVPKPKPRMTYSTTTKKRR